MKLEIKWDEKVVEVANVAKSLGAKAYAVGGFVRDKLLNKSSKDIDICITGLNWAKEFEQNLPEAKIVGKSFPVYNYKGIDIAFARKERKVKEGKKGFQIITNENITIEEDLKRRDFTINAMAVDIITCELIDPYNGMSDLRKGIIKAVSEAFREDPSRVYRGARFASQLGFEVEEGTLKMMNSLKSELSTLHKEQVFEELRKALLGKKPSEFFLTLKKCDCLEVHFKEVANLIGVEQPVKYHPEGDVFNHTMQVIDLVRKEIDSSEKNADAIIFASLAHDFGKAVTPKNEWPHHHGHEIKGLEIIREMCKINKYPKLWKDYAIASCKFHMIAGFYDKLTTRRKVTFLEEVSKTKLGLHNLEIIANADKKRDNTEFKGIEFENIAKKMFKEVSFSSVVANENDINKAKMKLHQKRVDWYKKLTLECN